MKSYKLILPVLALGAIAVSCDDDIETVKDQGKDIVPPVTFSELYYQNLREYKASDHEIAFAWFSKYGGSPSMHARFAALPDSIDLVSLWGGIPSHPVDVAEMRFHQQKMGTKFMPVDICRINKVDEQEPFKKHWLEVLEKISETNSDTSLSAEEKAAKLAEYEKEKHVVMVEMAHYYLDLVFLNDLDGMDIDFEPEGDPVQGELFYTMLDELARYLGPNPNITKEERYELIKERYGAAVADKPGSCERLLCIDAYGQDPGAEHCAPLIDYFLSQDYNGIINRGGYPPEKVVHCMSVGEDWNNDPATTGRAVGNYYTKQGRLYDWARWEPSSGRKGGFGAFIINDDYTVTQLNPWPYARFRDCIQICNPAIY